MNQVGYNISAKSIKLSTKSVPDTLLEGSGGHLGPKANINPKTWILGSPLDPLVGTETPIKKQQLLYNSNIDNRGLCQYDTKMVTERYQEDTRMIAG